MTNQAKTPSSSFPVVVPGVGPVPAPGMLVGEAPGRNEIKTGTPFCGESGKVLDEALDAAGSSRGEWYITNIFKGDVGKGNRNPTQEEVDAHWPLLLEEIAAVKPAGILALGRVAAFKLTGVPAAMADLNGDRIAGPADVDVWPCYHPAATLYNRNLLEDFRYAVIRFVLVTRVLEAHGTEDRTKQHGNPGD